MRWKSERVVIKAVLERGEDKMVRMGEDEGLERAGGRRWLTLSTVPIAKGAEFPVVAWYILMVVGIVQMSM